MNTRSSLTGTIAYFSDSINLFTNATVLEFFRELDRNDVSVLLFVPDNLVKIPGDIKNTVRYRLPHTLLIWPRNPFLIARIFYDYLKTIVLLKANRVKIAVGQDHNGLIIAHRFKNWLSFSQLHYFSFELYFKEEITDKRTRRIKSKEVNCCKTVTDILIQDESRKQLLIGENNLKEGINWHLIPVAPASSGFTDRRETAIRTDFGIPADKIVLIHSGSVESWSGIGLIIAALEKQWPANYWVFIHSFEPFTELNPTHKRLLDLCGNASLTLYSHQFLEERAYYEFLRGFDAGIALYVPRPLNGLGKNIGEIGLASGKFSTFMLLGIPVITTSNSLFPGLLKEYDYGFNISGADELIAVIEHADFADPKYSTETKRLYAEVLDPTVEIGRIVNRMKSA